MADPGRARLPWEIVETLPGTSPELLRTWTARRADAVGAIDRARADLGLSLALYWAGPEGFDERPEAVIAAERAELVDSAADAASTVDDADLHAEVDLGRLAATWGPDTVLDRRAVLDRLEALRPHVEDEELVFRIDEWLVLDGFDRGDLDDVRARIADFATRSATTDLLLFRRREELWRGNLAMLTGQIDRAVAINQDAIAATSDTAGTPFSFQNVAITVAIERFLRRGLADVVDAIESIRASSPRVADNWTVGLAFALSESDRPDEAAALFEPLAETGFAAIRRDLNWIVTMQLLGLVASRLGDRSACGAVAELLWPYRQLDGTHGTGYASYGPVGRVVGVTLLGAGRADDALAVLDDVLDTRSDGPWTALTALDRARAASAAGGEDVRRLADDAAARLRAFGLEAWATVADAVGVEAALAGAGPPTAALADGWWTLVHPSGRATVADGVGVRHLVALLARAGESVPAAVLGGEAHSDAAGSVDRPLDAAARSAYRRRLDELAATEHGGGAEADALRRALAGDRYAIAADVGEERARLRVTKALGRAIDRISDVDEHLGEHLRTSIRTGRNCSYEPADGTSWQRVEA